MRDEGVMITNGRERGVKDVHVVGTSGDSLRNEKFGVSLERLAVLYRLVEVERAGRLRGGRARFAGASGIGCRVNIIIHGHG